jgi:hypothetical protein
MERNPNGEVEHTAKEFLDNFEPDHRGNLAEVSAMVMVGHKAILTS